MYVYEKTDEISRCLLGFRLLRELLHVQQPDMDEEADEDESHHEELVKQRGRYHDAVLFHGDERR